LYSKLNTFGDLPLTALSNECFEPLRKNKALFHKGGKGASSSSSKPVSRVLFPLARSLSLILAGHCCQALTTYPLQR